MRWHYRDPLLVWLLVGSFAAHVLEEWIGGFPEWLAAVAGGPLPRSAFIAFNTAGLAIATAAARAATRKEANGWMAVAITSALACNGLLHLAGSIATRSYSPGLVTSFVLYAPLSCLVFVRAAHQASGSTLRLGVLAGILFHAAVMAAAFSIARQAG